MFYLFFDDDAFAGDLRRVSLAVFDGNQALNMPHTYRGPYEFRRDALRVAEQLMWVAVGRNIERLAMEAPSLLTTLGAGVPNPHAGNDVTES